MINLRERLLELNIVNDNMYLDKYCELCFNNKNTHKQKFKTQLHHIIPKWYFRYNNLVIDNSASNTVNLFYKDHVLAHYYLALCAKDKKFLSAMIYAINIIIGSKQIKDDIKTDLNSILITLPKYQELYETSIKIKSENISKKLKGVNKSDVAKKHMSEAKRGRKLTEQHKRKISQKLKGCKQPWAGRKQSQEEIEKRRQKLIGHITSQETRNKISKANTGRQISEKHKEALRQAHLGKASWNKGLPAYNHGLIQISKIETQELKYINESEVLDYIKDGWVKGNYFLSIKKKGKSSNTEKKILCIEDDIIYSSVKEAASQPRCSCLFRSIKNINVKTNNKHWVLIQKLEKWQTMDLQVIDIEEGTNSNKGVLGALLVRYKDGNVVKVGSGYSKELRSEIWNNKEKWLGAIIEVQYFEETENDNGGKSLRFPVFKDIRTDKDVADY